MLAPIDYEVVIYECDECVFSPMLSMRESCPKNN